MVVKGGYFKSNEVIGIYFLTGTDNTYEVRDTMVLDVPNAFIQTNITTKKYGEEEVITKITGVLVDILV